MTKMGSIVGHRIDYNGVGVLRGQRHIPSKTWPKCPPGLSMHDKEVLKVFQLNSTGSWLEKRRFYTKGLISETKQKLTLSLQSADAVTSCWLRESRTSPRMGPSWAGNKQKQTYILCTTTTFHLNVSPTSTQQYWEMNHTLQNAK